jgi:putative membrane protein
MWNWNPLIGAILAFVGWRYMDGVWRLWRRAGTGRGVRHWQVGAFWSGLAVLFLALITPIDTLSKSSLSMHMIQHLLLMIIAPPLLVIGMPPLAVISMVPMPWRQGLVRWLNRQRRLKHLWHGLNTPLMVWGLFALILWGWHVPALYQAAIGDSFVHLLEHGSFFNAGMMFWWSLRNQPVIGVLMVFTTAVHSSILGALMTFSTQIWYPVYNSLEDQQLAGLIMWIPGGVIFLITMLLLLWRWLQEMEIKDAKTMG